MSEHFDPMADVVPLAVGVLLAAACGVALTSLLRIGRGVRAPAAFVLGLGSVVALSLALSPAHWFRPGPLLAAQAALAVGLVPAAWRRRSSRGARLGARDTVAAAWGELRASVPVAMLVAGAAAALLAVLLLGFLVAPNEADSLLYHLPRAALMVQRHTVFQAPPFLPGDPRVVNPPNAEILQAWTIALLHGDQSVALVEWVALVGLAVVVFSAARELGHPVTGALLAGAVVVLMPAPLLQASTPLNDLLLAFLVGCGALLVARGLRRGSLGELAAGGCAWGLALGTKPTAGLAALVLLPGLVLVLLRERPPGALLLRALPCVALPVVLLGGANYLENLYRRGDPLGGSVAALRREYAHASAPVNAARVVWLLTLDAPGFRSPDELEQLLSSPRAELFRGASGAYFTPPDAAVQTQVDEANAAFGITGAVLLLPLVLWAVVSPRAPPAERMLALAAVLFVAVFASVMGYSPDGARLVMPGVLLAAPLLAHLAARGWSRAATAALALIAAWPLLVADRNKRVLSPSMLAQTRVAQQLAEFGDIKPVLRALGGHVGPREALGYVETRDYTDTDWPVYPLFGDGPSRRVELMTPAELSAGALRRRRLRAVFVPPSKCHGPGCSIDLRGLPHAPLGGGVQLVLIR